MSRNYAAAVVLVAVLSSCNSQTPNVRSKGAPLRVPIDSSGELGDSFSRHGELFLNESQAATLRPGDEFHAWSLIASHTGTVRISTQSDADTVLHVFEQDDYGRARREVAMNDDCGDSLASCVELNVDANQPHWVIVHGFAADVVGTFTIEAQATLGEMDAGDLDAGELDAGELDAAAPFDAATSDAGGLDAAVPLDAGRVDASRTDAGSARCTSIIDSDGRFCEASLHDEGTLTIDTTFYDGPAPIEDSDYYVWTLTLSQATRLYLTKGGTAVWVYLQVYPKLAEHQVGTLIPLEFETREHYNLPVGEYYVVLLATSRETGADTRWSMQTCPPPGFLSGDRDGDGYGGAMESMESACPVPHSWEVDRGGDCEPLYSGVNPGAHEICGNRIDDDCSGGIDDDAACTGALCGGFFAPCSSDSDCCGEYSCESTEVSFWPLAGGGRSYFGSESRCMLGPVTPDYRGEIGERCYRDNDCRSDTCISGSCAESMPLMCGGAGSAIGSPGSCPESAHCCRDQICSSIPASDDGWINWGCSDIRSCAHHVGPGDADPPCCPGFFSIGCHQER